MEKMKTDLKIRKYSATLIQLLSRLYIPPTIRNYREILRSKVIFSFGISRVPLLYEKYPRIYIGTIRSR